MSSALVFIFVLGLLVVVHEFGHFIVAKMVGIRVEKFSIGFGPVIFGKKYGETEFCVSILPLGGFVKLAGESPEEAKGMEWEFQTKSLVQKFAVVFAGPFMNALLAFIIFAVISFAGQPTLTSKIGKVMPDTPAMAAGMLAGDAVTAINGKEIVYWEDILMAIRQNEGNLLFQVDREGIQKEILIVPATQDSREASGKKVKIPFVGIAPSNEILYVKSPFWQALYQGAERVWVLTALIFHSLWLMISGALSVKDSVTGPIGIFFMTQEAAKMGIVYLFYFTGSLSVSLFVLNLLPIPVLDGGHVLFILIEKLKGSPIKESTKERMTQGGLVLLLALMAFVIFQDIHRFSIVDHVKNLIGFKTVKG